MAQFAVHHNANPATRSRFPYLLDVQSDLLDGLHTRVVAPLCPVAQVERVLTTLMPVLEVSGAQYVMLTPQLAGIPCKQLGARVADLSAQRGEIIAAMDFLLSGV